MKKGATTSEDKSRENGQIIALRNEKGSYNMIAPGAISKSIIALRNEKGSYNSSLVICSIQTIIALRNEKGSYNSILVDSRALINYSTAK
ncbi:hypothetical protein HMPREF9417_0999 [Haemophilus parainfluenzae ATCC 33392]|nr:hypothetical protein HMPREF9417_0999 [Haemophilus parainfluenzae ATCC 33392]